MPVIPDEHYLGTYPSSSEKGGSHSPKAGSRCVSTENQQQLTTNQYRKHIRPAASTGKLVRVTTQYSGCGACSQQSSFVSSPSDWLAVSNISEVMFMFPCSEPAGSWIVVQEKMGEGSLTWSLPTKLLTLLNERNQDVLNRLEELPQLNDHYESQRNLLAGDMKSMMTCYDSRLADARSVVCENKISFKKTVRKCEQEVEFIATNLHVQRLTAERVYSKRDPVGPSTANSPSPSSHKRHGSAVASEQAPCMKTEEFDCLRPVLSLLAPKHDEGSHDVITVGAPSAHSLRFKGGGLHRLLSAVNPAEISSSDMLTDSMGCSSDILPRIEMAHRALKEAIAFSMLDEIRLSLSRISSILEDSTKLEEMAASVHHALRDVVVDPRALQCADAVPIQQYFDDAIRPMFSENVSSEVFKEESAINYISSKVDKFFNTWLAAVRRNRSYIGFLYLKIYSEVPSLVAGVGSIAHRRDIVFSQALSALISGVVTRLQNMGNMAVTWLPMILNQGILVVWESLLSTHGDESHMLEDMYVGTQLLRQVTVEVVASSRFNITLSGSVPALHVSMHFPPASLDTIPNSLIRQRLAITPCLFTQGVNENQVKADWFGHSKLQDEINSSGHDVLKRYSSCYLDKLESYMRKQGTADPLASALLKKRATLYMSMLASAVEMKKERNIDVLTCASQVCLLFDGVRIVSCKSAKDRTGMSVTLEECLFLVNRFDLPLDKFSDALATIRSDGTRLENTRKNIGVSRYAFHQMQLKVFPKLLRPPDGTYGSAPT